MTHEEMVVAIIATVSGVGVLGFIVARVTGLIKSWIERDKGGYDEETFNRLATAFVEYKKETDRRMKHLEAIVADEDSDTAGLENQGTDSPATLEIKNRDEKQQNRGTRNLRNMLEN